MLIKIVSIDAELRTAKNGKSYKALTVIYKGSSGKIENKTLMPFGANERTVKILSEATPGSSWEVTTVKNDAGYWDWPEVAPSNGEPVAQSASPAKSGTSYGGGESRYETSEERAKKQIYIIRQSSLSSAVATLTAGVKTPPSGEQVIALAKQYESYVLDTDIGQEVVASPATVADLEDDDIDF